MGNGLSWASSDAVRRSMLSNGPRDTGPELVLRSALHRAGLRFKVDARPLPGLNRRADVVFTRARVAVFMDGCFWHGCPTHYRRVRLNAHYWGPKVEANRRRDADTDARLTDAGWQAIRFWEHEVRDASELEVAVHWVQVCVAAGIRIGGFRS